jgi:hypothetical protein
MAVVDPLQPLGPTLSQWPFLRVKPSFEQQHVRLV